MKKIFAYLLIIAGIPWWDANCQETLTLDEAHGKLRSNYPLVKEYELHGEISKLKVKNVYTSWYPRLMLNAQATYQSDVIEIGEKIPIPNASFPEPPRDQYKISMDINQVIYDGGLVRARASLESKLAEADIKQVEINMHKLKEKLNALYFNVLLMDEYIHLFDSIIANLHETERTIETALENGVFMPSDLYALQAEIIKMEKQHQDFLESRKSSMSMLKELIGADEDYKLVCPVFQGELMDSIKRPENELFKLQKEKLDYNNELLSATRLPKVYAFSQLGYGNPGLNMLNDEFDSFYIIGARLQWNIWDWRQTNREKQVAEVRKRIVDAEEDAFREGIYLSLERKKTEIERFRYAIQKNRELLDLRKKITSVYKSRLENGTITTGEFLEELNKELEARLGLETAKIQLTAAIIGYNTLAGD